LALVVRLRLIDIPMERDEGEYAYAGMEILRGYLPYKDFYNMKLPGVYYTYALVFKLLGNHILFVRFLLLFLNIATTFLLFQISKRWLTLKAAYISAGVFLILSLGMASQGIIANCEHFVIFWAFLGIWLLTYEWFLLAGACFALSYVMKQHGLFFLLFGFFYIAKDITTFRRLEKRLILRGVSLTLGFLLPLILMTGWLKATGIFEPFYFYTVEYARAYAGLTTPTFKYISNFKYFVFENPIFWLLFFIAFYHLLPFNKKYNFQYKNTLLVIWLCSFAAVCPGWHFRPHYFQYVLPISAMIVGFGYQYIDFSKVFKNDIFLNKKLIFICLCMSISIQFNYLFKHNVDKISFRMYPGDGFPDIKEMAFSIKDISQPSDKIGQIANEPQLWFYAERRGASGYLYNYPLFEKQAYANRMIEHYIKEMEYSKPRWFVIDLNLLRLDQGYSDTSIVKIRDWSTQFLKGYYLKASLNVQDKIQKQLDWLKTPSDTMGKRADILLYERL
jgi:hypothetical protein